MCTITISVMIRKILCIYKVTTFPINLHWKSCGPLLTTIPMVEVQIGETFNVKKLYNLIDVRNLM
jgi:hypothetical protein